MQSPLRIGTRASPLARAQALLVQTGLKKLGVPAVLREFSSSGDENLSTPLYEFENQTPGLFVKQLQVSLLSNEIDIAVHSLKDLPTVSPPGLHLLAIPPRASARDCLVLRSNDGDAPTVSPEGLPTSDTLVVGTSSLRREGLLAQFRPHWHPKVLRGNVGTRLSSVESKKFDAIVLAEAGLNRLQFQSKILNVLPLSPSSFVPAPGQGALGIEIRSSESASWRRSVEKLDDSLTRFAVTAERRVLNQLEGGCSLPLGVFCRPLVNGPEIVWTCSFFLGVFHERESQRRWIQFKALELQGTDLDALSDQAIQSLAPLRQLQMEQRS